MEGPNDPGGKEGSGMILLLTLVCFLSGSFMFSYWLGLLAKTDIKEVGDGNPGAANLWKAKGYKLGLTGIAFDFLKGYLPIYIIVHQGWADGFSLIPIALAPIFGHAFSPFMKGKGGKSIAVSFGVWSALTQFHVSLAYAIILAILLIGINVIKKGKATTSEEDGLQTTFGMLLLIIFLIYQQYPQYILCIWLGNFIILVLKNKKAILQLVKKREEKENVSL